MNEKGDTKIYSKAHDFLAHDKVTDNIKIQNLEVSAYTIPTETPEADGTLQWDSTTLVLVEITAVDKTGIGYTYADSAAAHFIHDTLKELVLGQNAINVSAITDSLIHHARN